jgi:hypothetical protein
LIGRRKGSTKVLEDMLRACALKHGGSWDKSLPFAEFSYNNSYQASLKMAPFKIGESQLFGHEIIKEAER